MDAPTEAKMDCFGGLSRLVNRNPSAVPAVLINGKLAVHNGDPVEALGKETGYGRVLRATDPAG